MPRGCPRGGMTGPEPSCRLNPRPGRSSARNRPRSTRGRDVGTARTTSPCLSRARDSGFNFACSEEGSAFHQLRHLLVRAKTSYAALRMDSVHSRASQGNKKNVCSRTQRQSLCSFSHKYCKLHYPFFKPSWWVPALPRNKYGLSPYKSPVVQQGRNEL